MGDRTKNACINVDDTSEKTLYQIFLAKRKSNLCKAFRFSVRRMKPRFFFFFFFNKYKSMYARFPPLLTYVANRYFSDSAGGEPTQKAPATSVSADRLVCNFLPLVQGERTGGVMRESQKKKQLQARV